jgi:hypothetical protein
MFFLRIGSLVSSDIRIGFFGLDIGLFHRIDSVISSDWIRFISSDWIGFFVGLDVSKVNESGLI